MGVMLDRWAEKHREIENVLELLNDLQERRIITWEVMRPHPREAVYEWFEIDAAQLERERREVLEAQRKVNQQ